MKDYIGKHEVLSRDLFRVIFPIIFRILRCKNWFSYERKVILCSIICIEKDTNSRQLRAVLYFTL